MRGKRAPEIAAGEHLDRVFEQIWRVKLASVVEVLRDVTLSAPQWTRILNNLQGAKTHLRTLLQLKMDFAKRLPFYFAVLAHSSEDTARSGGQAIMRIFREAGGDFSGHHRITQRLFSDTKFVAELGRFCDGCPRGQLDADVLRTIAVWRFVPIVETTIEEKHSRLALQLKRHGVGPVRVSLTNREPLLERVFSASPIALEDLVREFGRARCIKDIPQLLNFENHPELERIPKTQSKLVPALGKILYRSDLTSLFFSQREVVREAGAKRRLEERQEAQHMPKRRPVTVDSVIKEAIREHFRETAALDCVFSVPAAGGMEVETLGNFLDSSESLEAKRRRILSEVDYREIISADVEVQPSESEGRTAGIMFFKPVMMTPSMKKFLHVAPEAGRRLRREHIAVSIHGIALQSRDGTVMIASTPVGEHSKLDPVSLLGDLGDAAVLEERFLAWPQAKEQSFFFARSALPETVDDETFELVQRVVTDMVGHSAFETSRAYSPPEAQRGLMDLLSGVGLVQSVGDATYCLTQIGLRSLQQAWTLCVPQRVCERRPELAIEDCTCYELICRLSDAGWRWQLWKGRRWCVGYVPGDAKIWFTTGNSPPRAYLQVLLRAEETTRVSAGMVRCVCRLSSNLG